MSYCLVYVTVPNVEEGARIGRALVQERLAACANLLPAVRSFFWWEGSVQDEGEALLLCKTRQALLTRLTDRVRELHSYTVPCITAVALSDGNPEFLRWIDTETAASD